MWKVSEQPLHAQIRQSIQRRISDGEWPQEYKIPPEEELARDFNVSRMTVRQAVQNLVEKGYLYRRRGIGTFVFSDVMERNLSKLTSFSEDAKAIGVETSSQVIETSIQAASEEIATELRLEPEERAVRIERLRFHEESPVALQSLWVPETLCSHLQEREIASASVYAHYEQAHNYRIGWGVQGISAAIPGEYEREALRMTEEIALLVVRRTTFLDNGAPLEFSETRYRSDQQAFTGALHR